VRFSTIFALAFVLLSLFAQYALAQDKAANQASLEAEHKRAIDLAHDDKHAEALAILRPLLVRHPDYYPVRRDYIVVSAWHGDCDNALKAYEPIRNRPNKESYLIIPVAECMASLRRTDEATALLQEGRDADPGNEDIQQAQQSLQNDIALDRKAEIQVSAGTSESDAGNRENFISLRYSRQLLEATRWFVRYLRTWAQDDDFATGDLKRVGVGVMHWFDPKWYLEQEFADELGDWGDEFGSTTTLVHYPHSLWEIRAQYASFAEDIPLRAKAIDVDASRFSFGADFHSRDYVWEWSGSYTSYDFSDGNDREGFYTALGYGYVMKPRLEQRIIGSYYQSSNTLDNTVYFNPDSDSSITLTHRTSYVFDSRYDRHVDHLSVFVGQYDQEGFGSDTFYGVRYEQDYDFDSLHSLHWGAGYASNIYDGNRESEISFIVTFTKKLP
jgi:hypothetical protein